MRIVMSIGEDDGWDQYRLAILNHPELLVKAKDKATAITMLTEEIDAHIEALGEIRKQIQDL